MSVAQRVVMKTRRYRPTPFNPVESTALDQSVGGVPPPGGLATKALPVMALIVVQFVVSFETCSS